MNTPKLPLKERLIAVSQELKDSGVKTALEFVSWMNDAEKERLREEYSSGLPRYKLLHKTHWETGMNYLCVTTNKDIFKYPGSGVAWTKLIDKQGNVTLTRLLFASDDQQEFDYVASQYSDFLEVHKEKNKWSNLIPEYGYEGNTNNFVLYMQNLSDKDKKEFYARRGISIAAGHWTKTANEQKYNDIVENMSAIATERWAKLSYDKQQEILGKLHAGARNHQDNLTEKEKKKISEDASVRIKAYYATAPFEVVSEKNRKQRLNMSPEGKAIRADKVRATRATKDYSSSFKRMGENRTGANNPAAQPVILRGIPYGSISDAIKLSGLSRKIISQEAIKISKEEYRGLIT